MPCTPKPVIGISCCIQQVGPHPFHMAGEKYILAAQLGAGGLPLLIPSLGNQLDNLALLDSIDGLLLTGSPSNVEPHHYQGPPSAEGTHHDPARDATTLPLIRAAIERGIPLLGICRGFQEMNVALGGSLHQRLHETGLFQEHREDKEQPLDVQYGPAHPVQLSEGGLLASLYSDRQPLVNSLHTQGVERLAPGLRVEAQAEDGLIEAFSLPDAAGWVLAVQWHPEWKVLDNPFYQSIFTAFGNACRAYHAARAQRNP